VREHERVLADWIEQSRYLMDAPLEDLAAELQLSGGGAMWKLQGTVTSQLKAPFEQDGKTTLLPMTRIRNLANDPDESVRRRAYEAELKAWESVREPVAFSLNCVKGAALTLAKWQGRDDVLHATLDRNRIDRETLEALLAAMRDSLPRFRRYLLSKAAKLGRERLPWWDILAPVGDARLSYTWDQARETIVCAVRPLRRGAGRLRPHRVRAKLDRRRAPRRQRGGASACASWPARSRASSPISTAASTN